MGVVTTAIIKCTPALPSPAPVPYVEVAYVRELPAVAPTQVLWTRPEAPVYAARRCAIVMGVRLG